MTFQLALMTIQAEMVAVFAHELVDNPAGDQAAAVNIGCLTEALSRASDRTLASLKAVSDQLHDVLEHVELVLLASVGCHDSHSTGAWSSQRFPTPAQSEPCSLMSSTK